MTETPFESGLPRDAKSGSSKPMFPTFRRGFFSGVLIATPVLVTLWLTLTVVTGIDSLVIPLLPAAFNPGTYLGFDIPGWGVFIGAVVLTLIGWLLANVFGLHILEHSERLVARMPVIRSIYKTTQEVMGTIISRTESSFSQVGLVEYPRPGVWAIVLITANSKGAIGDLVGDDVVSVFLPTTPNPTTGFLLYVPRREIRMLDISVEDAMKLVVSAGLVGPDRVTGQPATGARTLIGHLRRQIETRAIGGKR
jgi:uncharacterized membrane protein